MIIRFLELVWRFAWLTLLAVFLYVTWPAWELLLRLLARFSG